MSEERSEGKIYECWLCKYCQEEAISGALGVFCDKWEEFVMPEIAARSCNAYEPVGDGV